MQNNSPDKLLTRNEVEAEFGLSRRFLELSAWRGDGPPMIRIGRRAVRYKRSDIVAWIEAQRIEPETLGSGAITASRVNARTGREASGIAFRAASARSGRREPSRQRT